MCSQYGIYVLYVRVEENEPCKVLDFVDKGTSGPRRGARAVRYEYEYGYCTRSSTGNCLSSCSSRCPIFRHSHWNYSTVKTVRPVCKYLDDIVILPVPGAL